MFVLRYKKDYGRKLYNPEKKTYEDVNLGGLYLRFEPNIFSPVSPATSNLENAKLFNTKMEAKRSWDYINCELVEVEVSIKEVK